MIRLRSWNLEIPSSGAASERLTNNVEGDKAEASFDKGILRLLFPHTAEAHPRSLKIELN